jgi:hypothetical protein
MAVGPSAAEEMILDCYRLAEHYHQHPDVFLAMPLEDVKLHAYRTAQLIERRRAASGD